VRYDPTFYLGSAAHYRPGRPPYSPQLESLLTEELGLEGSGRLLDAGCGPGILVLRLAGLFEEVVGLDPDPDMLQEGVEAAADGNVTNVRWVQAVAEDLPHAAPDPYGLVTFGQSFHWTDELRVAEVVYDMLEPGGAMAMVVHTVKGRPVPESPGPPPIPHDDIKALIEGKPDLVRDTDGVISNYLSMSSSAPHLFGDRLDAFTRDMHDLLADASPSGLFWDWPGDTEVVLAEKPR